ncbi:MAG: hypothetical protein CMC79_05045 [Flavobacteriaceae bacterium]|nr:hypothetical protein [Flavobacteriaceae bacterium]|tara:strand:- start:10678 stop:11178 length:501 start_codon:yes stop_codon:yes gene_type:complete
MLKINLQLTFFYLAGLILQVFFFELWDLFGYIDPMFYIIFIIFYQFDGSKSQFIILSFSLGFFIDILTQNPGANSISCLLISFIRPLLINFSFGINSDISHGMITGTRVKDRFLFLGLTILFHHLFYFITTYFSFYLILNILISTILTGILSFILIGIVLGLMIKK